MSKLLTAIVLVSFLSAPAAFADVYVISKTTAAKIDVQVLGNKNYDIIPDEEMDEALLKVANETASYVFVGDVEANKECVRGLCVVVGLHEITRNLFSAAK